MRIKILNDHSLLRRDSTPTPFDIFAVIWLMCAFQARLLSMLMPRNFVLVVGVITLPSITIEFSSILTRICLVWNSIATVLFTSMCNLLDLDNSVVLVP